MAVRKSGAGSSVATFATITCLYEAKQSSKTRIILKNECSIILPDLNWFCLGFVGFIFI